MRRRLAGVALALGVAACTSADDAGVDEPAQIDAAADVDRALASSVRVEASGCTPTVRNGVATAIGDGLLVTVAHVVAGAETVEVVDAVGRRSAAEVVTFDPLLDIAALRTTSEVAVPVTIRPERAAADERGSVVVAGGDDRLEPVDVTVLRRATIETTDIYRDTDVTRPGFEIEASIEPGDSGAAVHLAGGVVGIVWARSTVDPEHAWAIDVPDRFLDEAGAARSPVDTGPCP
jgi:S1-C subfamily serine protease